MDLDLRVADEAAERWSARQKEREARRAAIDEGRISDVETPERIKRRVDRLTEATLKRKVERRVAEPSLLMDTLGLERVLGKSDFLGTDFLEMALAVSRFVGRINIRSGPGRTVGFGTGFMVSPRLLMTNNHVLQTGRDALYSEVEFDYQYDRYDHLLPVVVYGLEPESFFIASKELDFTLVAVRELSADGKDLKRYGWSPLIEAQGKTLLGDSLNIVQHPKGEAKQIVLRSNQLVDLFADFAHYVTDTEPGSSGSPVYNDEWEVVALHHSGVPKMQDGNYIAKDGSIWRKGMDPDDLEWVANEGIRVSSLVNFVKKSRLAGEQARLRDEMLNSEPPHPLEAAAMAGEEAPAPRVGDTEGSFTWTIPLRVTVSLGTASPTGSELASGAGADITLPTDRRVTPMTEEVISIDPNYGNRKGYDPSFLGAGASDVPLPSLSDTLKADVAVNTQAADSDEHVLPYNHFSVVMNKRRKLAFFTAVNIDGNLTKPIRRDTDRWFLDPRIGEDEQTGEAVYASNPLDRGHLVRRLDPAWDVSEELAKVANDDTFHFTNCSPQHEDFNQNSATWAGLEDYILGNAIAHDLRVSVFTGPVFDTGDPQYRGVQLPRQFWKVVTMVKDDGALSATAYLLSQESLLEGLEGFSFADYKTFQVPIRKVEELTGLGFGDLKEADPAERSEVLEEVALGAREIATLEDLML